MNRCSTPLRQTPLSGEHSLNQEDPDQTHGSSHVIAGTFDVGTDHTHFSVNNFYYTLAQPIHLQRRAMQISFFLRIKCWLLIWVSFRNGRDLKDFEKQ